MCTFPRIKNITLEIKDKEAETRTFKDRVLHVRRFL